MLPRAFQGMEPIILASSSHQADRLVERQTILAKLASLSSQARWPSSFKVSNGNRFMVLPRREQIQNREHPRLPTKATSQKQTQAAKFCVGREKARSHLSRRLLLPSIVSSPTRGCGHVSGSLCG